MWCHAMHTHTMWPLKGEYRCRTCLRTYPVAWEVKGADSTHAADKLAQRMRADAREHVKMPPDRESTGAVPQRDRGNSNER
jgi:hypothetical protein